MQNSSQLAFLLISRVLLGSRMRIKSHQALKTHWEWELISKREKGQATLHRRRDGHLGQERRKYKKINEMKQVKEQKIAAREIRKDFLHTQLIIYNPLKC